MGVPNDYYLSWTYKAKPGMSRFLEECIKEWGTPFNWKNKEIANMLCEWLPIKNYV